MVERKRIKGLLEVAKEDADTIWNDMSKGITNENDYVTEEDMEEEESDSNPEDETIEAV